MSAAAAAVALLLLAPAARAESAPWFATSRAQQLSSSETAAQEKSNVIERLIAQVSPQKKAFLPPSGQRLPYPVIYDNTEGAAAFADIVDFFPSRPGLLLDVGAGRSDEARRFVEGAKRGWRVLDADPYNRSAEENAAAQRAVEQAGGADVATSMSVLNVVPEKSSRADHIRVLHRALRPGGLALFKVWAGVWPERGSGVATKDASQGTFQANAWASTFLPEVEAVFGPGNVYADNNLNLIVAVCST